MSVRRYGQISTAIIFLLSSVSIDEKLGATCVCSYLYDDADSSCQAFGGTKDKEIRESCLS